MKAEEAVQRGIADNVIATNQQGQIRTNKRNGGKQVHDHLCTPITHLAPWQQITHECLGHQAQENCTAKNPDQLTWLAIAAVHQPAKHVQVDNDKECRCACRMHVANQPAPRHIPHDVLDRGKSLRSIGLVMHHQEDAGHDLDHQHQHGQRAKDVPEIKILGRVIFAPLVVPELGQRKTVVDPIQQLFACRSIGGNFVKFSHVVQSQAVFVSSPIRRRVSLRYM